MIEQRGLFEAKAARDEAIGRVKGKNELWFSQALKLLPGMKATQREATGEEIRFWLYRQGLRKPKHPNAWGALTRTAVTRGILEDTGRMGKMTTVRSKARRTPIWRFK